MAAAALHKLQDHRFSTWNASKSGCATPKEGPRAFTRTCCSHGTKR
jgi:hypothetical protein